MREPTITEIIKEAEEAEARQSGVKLRVDKLPVGTVLAMASIVAASRDRAYHLDVSDIPGIIDLLNKMEVV